MTPDADGSAGLLGTPADDSATLGNTLSISEHLTNK